MRLARALMCRVGMVSDLQPVLRSVSHSSVDWPGPGGHCVHQFAYARTGDDSSESSAGRESSGRQRSTAHWFDTAAFGPPPRGRLARPQKERSRGQAREIVNIGIAKYFSIGERLPDPMGTHGDELLQFAQLRSAKHDDHSAGSAGTITAVGGGAGLDSTGPRSFRMGLRVEW